MGVFWLLLQRRLTPEVYFMSFTMKSKAVQMLYFSLSPILIPQANFCLLTSFFIQKQVERQLGMPGVSEGVSSFINYFLAPLCFMLKTA